MMFRANCWVDVWDKVQLPQIEKAANEWCVENGIENKAGKKASGFFDSEKLKDLLKTGQHSGAMEKALEKYKFDDEDKSTTKAMKTKAKSTKVNDGEDKRKIQTSSHRTAMLDGCHSNTDNIPCRMMALVEIAKRIWKLLQDAGVNPDAGFLCDEKRTRFFLN